MIRTEERNPRTTHIDSMSTYDMVSLMAEENFSAFNAVKNATLEITRAVDIIDTAMKQGGRLIYIGAGTSGRLGVLDAVECPPTFGVAPETVVGIIAGGKERMFCAAENAEDILERGREDVCSLNLTETDVLVGISAAGNAAYVIEGVREAKRKKASTIGLTCNPRALLKEVCDCMIVTDTGPEVISGSTRLNAGTAHKLVLNMLSTSAMIKQGYVYENMMINLRGSNEKLRKRQTYILSEICNITLDEAEKLLKKSNRNIKEAIKLKKGE